MTMTSKRYNPWTGQAVCKPAINLTGLASRLLLRLLMGLSPVLALPAFGQTEGAEQPEQAEQSRAAEPTFTLSSYLIEGPELVPRAKLTEILAGFTDRPITFAQLRTATSALERVHALAGYEVVRVLIPEQDVEPNGQLRLLIVDARLNEVLVDGASEFSDIFVINQLTSLTQGEVINTREMDRDLRLLSSNGSINARVNLEPGFEPQTVDAIVKVNEQPPTSTFITLDNTGTNATGDFRMGAVYLNNNLWDKGHQFQGQFVTSPGHWSDVKVFSLSYKAPVPVLNTLFEMTYSDSSVDAGTLAVNGGALTVQGSGQQLGLKAGYLLHRVAGLDARVLASYEFKKFDSEVRFNNAANSIVPDVASRPLGLGVRLKSQNSPFQRDFKLVHYRNQAVGANNNQAAYTASNANSTVNFEIWRGNAVLSDQFAGQWRYKAAFDFQYSRDSLISGEQFGAGGLYSVRGFDERAISADSGYRVSFELSSGNAVKPVIDALGDWAGNYLSGLNYVLFTEAAALRVTQPGAGTEKEPFIASYGAGLRLTLKPAQQIRFDVARVVSGLAAQPHGDWMLHFSYVAAL